MKRNVRRWFVRNPGWSAAIVTLLLFLIVVVNGGTGIPARDPHTAFLLTVLLIVVAIAAIGAAVNARPAGVLIDNRNRVSLSKFQATLWTVLILSSLIVIASIKLQGADPAPLKDIAIPGELLLAMGISAASLVATPVLLSFKAEEPTTAEAISRTADKLNLTPGEVRSTGKVFARTDPHLASWADMFRGDETSNAGDADLSKVQQFMISLLLVGIYAANVWSVLPGGPFLPPLDQQFVWLMGISHASYLAYKAAPHGTTGGSANAADPAYEAVG